MRRTGEAKGDEKEPVTNSTSESAKGGGRSSRGVYGIFALRVSATSSAIEVETRKREEKKRKRENEVGRLDGAVLERALRKEFERAV